MPAPPRVAICFRTAIGPDEASTIRNEEEAFQRTPSAPARAKTARWGPLPPQRAKNRARWGPLEAAWQKDAFSGCFDSPSLTRWSGIRSDIAQHDSGRIHSRQTGDITWQNLRNRTTRNDRNLSLRQTQGRDGKKTYCTFAPGSASSFAFTIL